MANADAPAALAATPKTALVFAGGGSFGAVQVGMLRALVAHGVKPDMVVGSSVGAMNGAYDPADRAPHRICLRARNASTRSRGQRIACADLAHLAAGQGRAAKPRTSGPRIG